MKKLLIVLGVFMAFGATRHATKELPFITMFNGRDMKDWTIKIKDHPLNDNFGKTFRVEDGLMKVRYDGYDSFRQQYGHIFYKKKFTAYLLVVEYRFVGKQAPGGEGWALRNSGAMLQSPAPETMPVNQDFPISLEWQMLGGNGTNDRPTGNLCTPGTNVVINNKLFLPHCIDSKSKTFHGEQWVHAEALVLSDSIIHHIVGADTVISYSKPQFDGRDKWVKMAGYKDGEIIKEGYISLQSESHPVDFRKAVIYDLGPYMNDPKKLAAVIEQLKVRKQNK